MRVSVDMAIRNADASMRMEGFMTSEETLNECRRVLIGEISHEDYIDAVKHKYMKVAEVENGNLQS